MGKARMHYFDKTEYNNIDLMLSALRPGKYYKLWTMIMQYAHATETGDDVAIPVTGDTAIDGFLRVMCADVRENTESYFRRVETNEKNGKKRWDKEKGKGEQLAEDAVAVPAPAPKAKGKAKEQPDGAVALPDKPKAKAAAPITIERCLKLAGKTAVPERVEKLYHELEAADWIYHGYRLRDLCERCMKCDEMRHTCGFGGVLYFNTITTNARALEVFNAYCDLGHELKWAFCDTCRRFRDDVKLRRDDNVILFQTDFDRVTSNYQEFERVEEFVAVLRKTYKN